MNGERKEDMFELSYFSFSWIFYRTITVINFGEFCKAI